MSPSPFVVLTPAVLLAAAALFARVADRTVAPQRTAPRDRWGATMFATWWTALGVACGFQGFSALLYALGLGSVSFQVLVVLGTMGALTVGLCGLAYSVIYMLTGRRLLAPVAAYHAALLVAFVVLLALSRPSGVTSAMWGARLVVDAPQAAMPWVLSLLFVPPLVSGAACIVLSRRLPPSGARTRFMAAGLSVVLLFVTALGVEIPGGASGTWTVLGLAAVLLAALAVIAAYEPPGWLRRALSVLG